MFVRQGFSQNSGPFIWSNRLEKHVHDSGDTANRIAGLKSAANRNPQNRTSAFPVRA